MPADRRAPSASGHRYRVSQRSTAMMQVEAGTPHSIGLPARYVCAEFRPHQQPRSKQAGSGACPRRRRCSTRQSTEKSAPIARSRTCLNAPAPGMPVGFFRSIARNLRGVMRSNFFGAVYDWPCSVGLFDWGEWNLKRRAAVAANRPGSGSGTVTQKLSLWLRPPIADVCRFTETKKSYRTP